MYKFFLFVPGRMVCGTSCRITQKYMCSVLSGKNYNRPFCLAQSWLSKAIRFICASKKSNSQQMLTAILLVAFLASSLVSNGGPAGPHSVWWTPTVCQALLCPPLSAAVAKVGPAWRLHRYTPPYVVHWRAEKERERPKYLLCCLPRTSTFKSRRRIVTWRGGVSQK